MPENTLVDLIEHVELDDIKPYHDNPRVGDVDVIAESLDTSKQYKPLVVQESTNEILAGNHTWQAAKRLGWETISIVRIDVDDEEAARIVVADNRTADLGTYNAEVLSRVLDSLPDTAGTGYDKESYQMLMDSVKVDTPEATKTITEIVAPPSVVVRTADEVEVDKRREEMTSGGSTGGITRPDAEAEEDEGLKKFESISSQLKGALQLREDMLFESSNAFGFPDYLPEMLVTPEDIGDLKTWVSQNLTPDDGSSHYLYTYNLGSSVGIPYERAVIGFYTYDDKFEQWWMMPANYTSKAINAGVKYMVVPDFSIFPGPSADRWIESGLPPVVNAMNVYRGRWMGRFFQEAGLKIIPNLITSWSEHDDWALHALDPVEMPVAITEAQTFRPDEKEDRANYQHKFETIFEYAKPGVLYVYTGNPGREFVQKIVDDTKPATDVRFLDSYSTVKNVHKKQRDAENKMDGKSGLFTSGEDRVSADHVETLKEADLSGLKTSGKFRKGNDELDDDSE